MPASLRSDYPINPLAAVGPFCPETGATFIGLRSMNERTISCSDVDAMTGYSAGQKRLMKMLITYNFELSELVDKVLVEAIDASDIGHHIEAESLFQETLALIEKKGTTDDYMFMPVLLHYCVFLHRYRRFDEYELALEEFNRVAALYE